MFCFKNFNKNKDSYFFEEGVKIPHFKDKISKKLDVFYNPLMKLNRDISLLVIKSYFKDKKIVFCDPMAASGIREIRFLKKIPENFSSLYIGDISKKSINHMKKNFKLNKVSMKKCLFFNQGANKTILESHFDFIEIDPFGSPSYFLDAAISQIKNNGILSITATDTSALCGSYPKKCLRKYSILVNMTFSYNEIGLRNLIAYCQVQAGKYDKFLVPIVSFSKDHYYKVFFKVQRSSLKSLNSICDLKFLFWDKRTQEFEKLDFSKRGCIGKTYVKSLSDKSFLNSLKQNLKLIEDNKKVSELIFDLENEIDVVGSYNIHKLQKYQNFTFDFKFDKIIQILEQNNILCSRVQNSPLCLKIDSNCKKVVSILKRYNS